MKPLEMIGEKADTDVIKDTEHYCPQCGSQIKGFNVDKTQAPPDKCPNCHCSLTSTPTDSGIIPISAPDAAKPHVPETGKNVKLNQVLFDSRTGKFIVADSNVEHPEQSLMDGRRNRKKMFPDMKDLPRVDPNLPSKEFKQFIDPSSDKRRRKVDSVMKSCTDLAIDG